MTNKWWRRQMFQGDLAYRLRQRLGRTVTAVGLALCLLHTAPAVQAQYQSDNVDLLSHLSLSQLSTGSGNDCWGYTSPSGREYALMGGSNKLIVVEITNPTTPVIVASIAHSSSSWGDIKVYQSFAYVCNESGGGIQVIDLTNIDQGQATLVRSFGPSTNHNIAIDEDSGFLYTAGARNGAASTVFDLSDPANPVQVGLVSGAYQHDAHIRTFVSGPYAGRQIFFGSSEGRGVDIFDVTNKASMPLLSRTSYPQVQYCHQMWTSDDGTLLYVDDELDELQGGVSTTRTIVFDVSDLSNPQLVNTFTSGMPSIDHNLYVRDGIIYEANYTTGLRIFDGTSDPVNPPQVGFFDTFPGGNGPSFDGAWSVYPFFPSGTVIVSDINSGLFVLDVSAALRGLSFEYPDGQPGLIDPDGGTRMRVVVTGRNAIPKEGSGKLHYDEGNGFQTLPMEHLGNSVYDAVFPPTTCGSTVLFFVTAEDSNGKLFKNPSGDPFSALSAASVKEFFADNFETDKGWTVENIDLQAGAWERGVPIGGGTRGDPPTDFDGSGKAYLTGNAPGDSDVDGGPTMLISPRIDLSGESDAIVSFGAWFYNDDSDEDRLDVEVSNDDGGTWTMVERMTPTGGWVLKEFMLADHITLTGQVRLRFSATDNPNNSVTEAAIDAVKVQIPVCVSNDLILEVDPLFAGQQAVMRASDATPDTRIFFTYSLVGEGLTFVPRLGVTLGLANPKLAGSAVADAGGVATFTANIPLIGKDRDIWLQAATFGRVSQVIADHIN